jgi:large subunit ribosomal protein L15
MANELSNLKPVPGSTHARKRLGRGCGSGLGKTSGRGDKGQGSRTGKGHPRYFEGGQMPLQRRLPKRGFAPLDHKVFAVVNLGDLNVFDDGANVDTAALVAAGLVRKIGHGVKILAKGDLTKKVNVVAHAFSVAAKDKIEKLGGTIRLVTEDAGV